jgi:hypothetical protein
LRSSKFYAHNYLNILSGAIIGYVVGGLLGVGWSSSKGCKRGSRVGPGEEVPVVVEAVQGAPVVGPEEEVPVVVEAVVGPEEEVPVVVEAVVLTEIEIENLAPVEQIQSEASGVFVVSAVLA